MRKIFLATLGVGVSTLVISCAANSSEGNGAIGGSNAANTNTSTSTNQGG